MFKFLKSFLSSLFKAARPGLEGYIKEYLPEAKEFVKNQIEANAGAKFAELKPTIFQFVKRISGSAIPDTWVSIVVDLAYEHLKAEALKRLDKVGA